MPSLFVTIFVATLLFCLMLVVACQFIMRKTGYYTGPLLPSPALMYRHGDRPLRIGQVSAVVFFALYVPLLFSGRFQTAQILFGLWCLIAGVLYSKSSGFPFSKLNPQWMGFTMTLLGVCILTTSTMIVRGAGGLKLSVAMGVVGVTFVAGIACFSLAFVRPRHHAGDAYHR